jgi:hypothetical protein
MDGKIKETIVHIDETGLTVVAPLDDMRWDFGEM